MRKLAVFALGFSAAVFAAGLGNPGGWLMAACAVAALAAMAGFALRAEARTAVMLACFGLAFGFFWSGVYAVVYYYPAAGLDGRTETVTAVVSGYPRATKYGSGVDVKLVRKGADIGTRLYLDDASPDLRPGDVLTLDAKLSLADSMYGERTDYYFARGVFLTASQAGDYTVHRPDGLPLRYWPATAAQAVKEKTEAVFAADTRGMALALLIGDTSLIDDELDADLKTSGLSHLVAVSGMQVVFLVGVFNVLLRRGRGAALVCIPMIALFAAVTGGAPSIVRAGVMQVLTLTAPLLGREEDGVTSLSFSLLVILIFNPFASASAGLQLSFAATAGMMAFAAPLYARFSRFVPDIRFIRGIINFAAVTLSATLAAAAFTIPLTALHFGSISIVSPLSNLLTVWAVSYAFLGSIVACLLGFIFTPLGALAGWPVSILIKYINAAVHFSASVPYACVYTKNVYIKAWLVYAYAVLGSCLAFAQRKVRTRPLIPAGLAAAALCLCLALTALGAALTEFSFTALDVGQGQSLVLMSEGRTVVVDCGGSSGKDPGAKALEFIKSRGSDKVDLLVLTHFHADHANGVLDLMRGIRVECLAVPEGGSGEGELERQILAYAEAKGVRVVYTSSNMSYNVGDMELELIAPIGSEDENERGLSVLCSANGFDALVTGDMSGKIERRLIKLVDIPDLELLMVGHHGSKYSTTEELLEKAKPEIAVISVGARNTYGQPAGEIIERLEDAGAAVYRTDEMGTITVKVD